jgi:hypothetical protein
LLMFHEVDQRSDAEKSRHLALGKYTSPTHAIYLGLSATVSENSVFDVAKNHWVFTLCSPLAWKHGELVWKYTEHEFASALESEALNWIRLLRRVINLHQDLSISREFGPANIPIATAATAASSLLSEYRKFSPNTKMLTVPSLAESKGFSPGNSPSMRSSDSTHSRKPSHESVYSAAAQTQSPDLSRSWPPTQRSINGSERFVLRHDIRHYNYLNYSLFCVFWGFLFEMFSFFFFHPSLFSN